MATEEYKIILIQETEQKKRNFIMHYGVFTSQKINASS